MTPLAIAARNGHEYVVKALVNSRSVDLDSTCDTGRTPMSWAMLCGHHKIVKVLSLAGAYESIPDYHGTSAQSMQEGIQNLATVTIEHQSDA
ncbi:hypothetical protein BDW74DRAFT_155477 [Aspergillus multicolor]|uniref:uncharacterized protein n=1 Tax=Aspergillus multicolor TaxID=41759 RepID=UPI003CCCD1D3